jgi:hypothetical protein
MSGAPKFSPTAWGRFSPGLFFRRDFENLSLGNSQKRDRRCGKAPVNFVDGRDQFSNI